jgi:phosphatidylserine decarboxylase
MVRDGYYYGFVMLAAAGLVAWLTSPTWAVVPVLLGAFFLWFFRDPERAIPSEPGAVVSPADGKITDVSQVTVEGKPYKRISIFLNVFDVHVNRSPIAGVVRGAKYQEGKFLNAMDPQCADCNEQNTVTVEGEGHTIIFKQIAGLLARRIVFSKNIGEKVERGERVGLIKFGSRTDIMMGPSAEIQVKVGDRVKGGASILAFLEKSPPNENRVGWGTQVAGASTEQQQHRRR